MYPLPPLNCGSLVLVSFRVEAKEELGVCSITVSCVHSQVKFYDH